MKTLRGAPTGAPLSWYSVTVSASPKTCKYDVNGEPCGKPVRASSMCMAHYQAERRRKLKETAAKIPEVDPAKTTTKRRNGRYSEQEIETGLLAMIMNGGSSRKASELTGISADTLKDWRLVHAPRYAELRREKGPDLERLAVDQLMGFVVAAEEAKHLALRKAVAQLEANDAKDPAATLRNIATAQGISVTKVMELTGRPTAQNQGMRSAQELLAGLARLGAIVNSTAEEIPSQPALPSSDSTVAATADSIEAGDT